MSSMFGRGGPCEGTAAHTTPQCAAGATARAEQQRVSVRRPISLLKCSPAIILIMLALLNIGRTTDPDLWGDICFGQAILSSRHLLLHDTYSYTAAGYPWRNHKWLSQILMALLYNNLGIIGLKLWRLVCTSGTLLFMILGLAETGASPTVQLCALVSVPVALGSADLRPQLFTFLLFAATLALLARDTYRSSAPLWLALPIMALWSNLHGGFVMGLAMLAVYATTCAVRDSMAGLGLGRSLRLILITAASALVTLATPHPGIAWDAAIHTLRNPLIGKMIEEWQPLASLLQEGRHVSYGHLVFALCALGLTAALPILLLLTPQGQDLPLVAIAAMMIGAVFVAVRNLPLAAMACAVPIARHAELALRDHIKAEAQESYGGSPPIRSAWWYILVAVGLLSLTLKGRIFSNRLIMDQPYPSGAIAFMQRHNLRGNVFNAYNWGEYLIWHVAPASKVSVDGRAESLYPNHVLEDAVIFYYDLPGAAEVLRSYPHDFVLIPPNSRAHVLMEKMAEWKLIYSDQDCVLYARSDSPAAKLSGIPVIGAAAPSQYFP